MIEKAHILKLMDVAVKHSTDPDVQVGAIIVNYNLAQNGVFPMALGANRHHGAAPKMTRTSKNIIHAEICAILAAARDGIPTNGAVMYLNWYPCMSCAQVIAGAGIQKLVCGLPNFDDEKWGEEFRDVAGFFCLSEVEEDYWREFTR